MTDHLSEQATSIGALAEPVRRALYAFVVAQREPASREQAADGVDVPLHTAKFHLDKLVEEGLLEVEFRRLTGRTGPGAGRPSKLYRRSAAEHAVSLPPRGYRALAEVFADAVEEAGVEPALYAAARRHGERLGRSEGGAEQTLRELGYEPYADGDVWRLRNCPFDGVARTHPGAVCGANLALLEGALGGGVRIDPRPEGCCVVVARDTSGTKNNGSLF
jgi:predicted ArsR family transcriptional regulator